MEKVAAQHYDYDQRKVEKPPEEKKRADLNANGRDYCQGRKKNRPSYKDMTVKCSGCSDLQQMSNLVCALHEYMATDDAVFVRLAYRQPPAEANSTGLIWQVFVKHSTTKMDTGLRNWI